MTNDPDEVIKAIELLDCCEKEYRSNYFKVWLTMVVGVCIALLLSPLTVTIMSKLGYSLYDRSGLDSLAMKYLANHTLWDM